MEVRPPISSLVGLAKLLATARWHIPLVMLPLPVLGFDEWVLPEKEALPAEEISDPISALADSGAGLCYTSAT